jgi:hypothetical protein
MSYDPDMYYIQDQRTMAYEEGKVQLKMFDDVCRSLANLGCQIPVPSTIALSRADSRWLTA